MHIIIHNIMHIMNIQMTNVSKPNMCPEPLQKRDKSILFISSPIARLWFLPLGPPCGALSLTPSKHAEGTTEQVLAVGDHK